MREFFKASWLVLVSSLGFGLLLAVTYTSWQPRIELNRRLALERGVRAILPDADSILTDTLSLATGPEPEQVVIFEGLDGAGAPVGYAFVAQGTGFQDRIELLVGLNPELTRYRGIAVLFAAETPGFGDAVRDSAIFRSQFVGTPADSDLVVVKGPDGDRPKTDDYEIVSITGATITSESVTRIINARSRQVRPLLEETARRPRDRSRTGEST